MPEINALEVEGVCEFGAALLGCSDADDLMATLYKRLKTFIDIDGLVLLTYRTDAVPQIHYMVDDSGVVENRTLYYLTGPYLLDPFFAICQTGGPDGVYFVRDIAGPDFVTSEYFRSFFTKLGMHDEVNVIRWVDADHMAALSLGRPSARTHFDANARANLEALQPLIAQAIQRAWGQYRNKAEQQRDENIAFHRTLETLLRQFGSSVLTCREHEILHLLLRGYSIKSTADRLRITEGTVRMHRHNIYEKLDVRSQTEVFSLVLDSLRLAQDETGDPLVKLLPA